MFQISVNSPPNPHLKDTTCRIAYFRIRPSTAEAFQPKKMSLYHTYLQEIEDRKAEGFHAKPIDDAGLVERDH